MTTLYAPRSEHVGRIGLLVVDLDFSMFGGLEQHNKRVVVFCALVYELA